MNRSSGQAVGGSDRGTASSEGQEISSEEDQEPAPRTDEKSQRSSGKRTATPDARGAEKRAHHGGRSSYSSAYDLPESIPAYVLQFTSSSMQDTIAKTISSMHTSSNSMMQYERKRMYEAESECKRLEAVVNELRRSKVSCQLQLKYECFE